MKPEPSEAHSAGAKKSLQIALAAQLASVDLDEDRSTLYCDLIMNSLGEAARQRLRTMDLAKYQYQSEFARRYVAEGEAKGQAQGRAELVIRQLTLRFGALSNELRAGILQASIDELDAIGERLLTAASLHEALSAKLT